MHPKVSEAKLQLNSKSLDLLLSVLHKVPSTKTSVVSLAEAEKEECGQLHNCAASSVTWASDQGLHQSLQLKVLSVYMHHTGCFLSLKVKLV